MALRAALETVGEPGPPISHAFSNYLPAPVNQDVRELTLSTYYLALLKLGHFEDLSRFNAAGQALAPTGSYHLPTPIRPLRYNEETNTFPDRDDNKTDYRDDLYEYDPENLPDELYLLRRPSNMVSKRELRPVQLKKYPVYGKYLRDVPCLPDHISSLVPGYLLEFWARLDPRLELEDVLDRINPSHRDRCRGSALPMRRRRFRMQCGLLSWNKATHWRQDETKLLNKLADWGVNIALNTTRGFTPGVIDPANFQDSTRIPYNHARIRLDGNTFESRPDAPSHQQLIETGLYNLWEYPGDLKSIEPIQQMLQTIPVLRSIQPNPAAGPSPTPPVTSKRQRRAHASSHYQSPDPAGSDGSPSDVTTSDSFSASEPIQNMQNSSQYTLPPTLMNPGQSDATTDYRHSFSGQNVRSFAPFIPLSNSHLPFTNGPPSYVDPRFMNFPPSNAPLYSTVPLNNNILPPPQQLGSNQYLYGLYPPGPFNTSQYPITYPGILPSQPFPPPAQPAPSSFPLPASTTDTNSAKRRIESEDNDTAGVEGSFGPHPAKRARAWSPDAGLPAVDIEKENFDLAALLGFP